MARRINHARAPGANPTLPSLFALRFGEREALSHGGFGETFIERKHFKPRGTALAAVNAAASWRASAARRG